MLSAVLDEVVGVVIAATMIGVLFVVAEAITGIVTVIAVIGAEVLETLIVVIAPVLAPRCDVDGGGVGGEGGGDEGEEGGGVVMLEVTVTSAVAVPVVLPCSVVLWSG